MHTYVIGDVHGMLNKLEKLLDKIPFRPDCDVLAFLGDYIDRGPDSRGVIDRILNLLDRQINVVCLKGNHEAMFQDFLDGNAPSLFLLNGGGATLKSYLSNGDDSIVIPDPHLDFLDRLLPYFEMEAYILVHAGLRPGVRLKDQLEDDLLWIRSEFISSDFNFGKKVVFGHTHFPRPYIDEFKVGIDTGAVYGNLLTCVRLPDLRFYSV